MGAETSNKAQPQYQQITSNQQQKKKKTTMIMDWEEKK